MQLARELVGIVTQEDGAYPALARRNQDGSERAFSNGKSNVHVRTSGAVARGGHAQHAVRLFVEAPVRVVPGTVDRIGHGAAAIELRPDAIGAVRCRVGPGCQACDRLEDAMQVVGAQSGSVRQRLKARHVLGILDEPAQVGDLGGMLLGERRLIRLAAPARAKSRPLGIRRSRVKLYILGPGLTRAARRAAIHTGGLDRIYELAIRLRVARGNGRPTRVVDSGGCEHFCPAGHIHFASFQVIVIDV